MNVGRAFRSDSAVEDDCARFIVTLPQVEYALTVKAEKLVPILRETAAQGEGVE